MYLSTPPDDNLYDRHIDPAVYECPQNHVALPSPQTDSIAPSSMTIPYHLPHISHTGTSHAPPTYTAALNNCGNETGSIYLWDQEAFQLEVQTAFGSSHRECSAEEGILEPFQAFISEDMDYDMYIFSEGETFAVTWSNSNINVNAARNSPEDSATCHTSPSTTSTSGVDILYHKRTTVPSMNLRDPNFRSYQLGYSHASRIVYSICCIRTKL